MVQEAFKQLPDTHGLFAAAPVYGLFEVHGRPLLLISTSLAKEPPQVMLASSVTAQACPCHADLCPFLCLGTRTEAMPGQQQFLRSCKDEVWHQSLARSPSLPMPFTST
jgi:hypothetical protein